MSVPTKTERALERLCQSSFLDFWSHRSPGFDHRNHPNDNQGEELCDLIVVFGNTVLLFEDKECEWIEPKSGDLHLAWRRWYKRSIGKAKGQLVKAKRRVLKNPQRIFADKSCTTHLPVEIPKGTDVQVHLIAVVHGAAQECKKHFQGGSGSLVLNSNIVEDEQPFYVGCCARKKHFVHVFDEATIQLIIKALDTLPEFIDYLLDKEHLVGKSLGVMAAGEEDMLAHYLQDGDGKRGHSHGFDSTNTYQAVAFDEGLWLEYQGSEHKTAREVANIDSYAWDDLISRSARHSIAGTQEFTTANSPQESEKLFRWMNSETRTSRRLLVEHWLRIYEKAGQKEVLTHNLYRPSKDRPHYTFMVVRKRDAEEEPEYRLRRREHLFAYTALMRMRKPGFIAYIGIATGPMDVAENSEDFALVDERSWTTEIQELAEQLQPQVDAIGLNPVGKLMGKEYPDNPTTQRPRGKDRNSPCPCGSGIKYKKCHGKPS